MNFKYLIILFILTVAGWNVYAQDQETQKPKNMYIVDGKEVSEEYVMGLDPNRIKSMDKSLSDEKKKKLEEKYGERVNDSFIMLITLYTEEEMKNRKPPPKEVKENDEKKTTRVHAGEAAIDFSVSMIDGTSIKLSELKGKVVLLNFWATWCGPCLREFHEIPSVILDRFENMDFVFLPISRGETLEVVEKKMEKLKSQGVEFNVGIDPTKQIYSLYAEHTIPRNFLIDKEGQVVFTSIGYNEEKLNTIANKIEELLKED